MKLISTLNQVYLTVITIKIDCFFIASLLDARSMAQENSGLSSNEILEEGLKRTRKSRSSFKKNERSNIFQSPPAHSSEGNIRHIYIC